MSSDQNSDTDETGKLFVGGLSWETSQDNLQRYFSRYGEVIDCVVMKNTDSGRSRGFGFVTFSNPTNVALVLQNGPHTLDGRTIDPKPCNPRHLQKPKRGAGHPKVFLGGLPQNVTETELKSFFSRYGEVTEIIIMYDQEKKKSRGFGFLSFDNDDAVDRCVQEHYVYLRGKQVEVKRAEPRDGQNSNSNSSTVLDPGKMLLNDFNNWNTQAALAMVLAPNGQISGPPSLNMAANLMGPNMVQSYPNWGTTNQAQNFNFAAAPSTPTSFQNWSPSPAAHPPPHPPPSHWTNTFTPPITSQSYGSFDAYPQILMNPGMGPNNSASAAANWNAWPLQTNGQSAGQTGFGNFSADQSANLLPPLISSFTSNGLHGGSAIPNPYNAAPTSASTPDYVKTSTRANMPDLKLWSNS